MHFLDKREALVFVRERAHLFDTSPNPFAKSAWLLHFIEQIVEPGWKVIAAEAADGGSAMLLYSTPKAPQTRAALTNYYASLYTPVVGHGDATPLVEQLTRDRPRCATIDFSPLDAEAPQTAALERSLNGAGWYVRRYLCFGNWYQPAMPFEAYLAARESKLRHTLERKGRKFPGELRIVTEPGEVAAAMDGYDAVYAKSWKRPEPYPDFVRGWARICAAHGWLRLGIATVDGKAIAAQFWFTVDGKAYIFKLAYDEEHAKLSAGSLLTAKLMRHVLEVDRVGEVDYLTGDDPYKAAWMSHRRQRIGLVACNPRTLAGLARAAFERAGELRQRLKARAVTA